MFKKNILLSLLILNFVLTQNMSFAQDIRDQKMYTDNLQKKIEANWLDTIKPERKNILTLFPQNQDSYKSAVISFIINKNGSVSNVDILRSSGDEIFDSSVIAAIYKALPFERLAGDEDSLNIQYFFSPIFTNASIVTEENVLANTSTPQSTTTQIKTPVNNEINSQATTQAPTPTTDKNIVNVSNTTPCIDFTLYAKNLQEKIDSNWNPKSFIKERNATIRLNIDKDGSIEDIKIQKSSNRKNFDFEIVNSIMKSVPLEALPAGLEAKSKNIQINFSYRKIIGRNIPQKCVVANINPQNGYDEYIEQVEEIVSQRLKDKSYFCKKDIIVEMNIDKTGKLVYVKIKNDSPRDNFIKREFNRKTLLTLQKTSFPVIPNKMGVDDITISYRILTQRKRLFFNFICDYAWNFFRTGLESYCIQKPDNI